MCRTVNGSDINAEPGTNPNNRVGRGNLAPSTLILPTIAMEAKLHLKEGEDLIEKFMHDLDVKIHECKDMLIERYKLICAQSPNSAQFMWDNNTMRGYKPEEGIVSALKHGTLSIGQLGLAETLQILIGCDQTTKEGLDLGIRIEKLFSDRCKEFKEKYKLNFGVYLTPAENLSGSALRKFREKYGVIPNVSDKEYFTNSTHVIVRKGISLFDKIDIESALDQYSSAGSITYVELDGSVIKNIDALEEIVKYAMDHQIPYFAINVPSDYCEDCHYVGEINNECPKCGSKNVRLLRRVTGYLTGDYRYAFSHHKQVETDERKKHANQMTELE